MQLTETAHSGGQTRDININIRAKRTQRDLIDQAAELLGKTRSDFMLETALDAPPGENPELRKLMAGKAPWEA